ncbi:MAG: transaldolase, partial [Microbacterium sp. 14-71-5]
MTTPTAALTAAGVSIWLDDLSRTRITSGNLAELIASRNVVGVTTNPTIFANAITNPDDTSYDSQVAQLAASGASAEEAIFEATTQDVRDALDVFR